MRWIVPLALAMAPLPALAAHTIEYNSNNNGNRLSYVMMTGDDHHSMMSGSTGDYNRARALRAGNAPLLYVRQDGAAYVIRDAATLRRAEAIMAPQQELGRRQGELGRQQGALGRQQGALGAEQGRLGRQMAFSTPAQMRELGRQQGELGRRQGALGAQQGELGRRQGELGREQARLARLAEPQFRALLQDAIARGLAQRVD